MMIKRVILATLLFTATVTMTSAQKKPLDLDAVSRWKMVGSANLSQDGRWVSYKISYADNDAENEKIKNTYYLYDNKTGRTTILNNISEPNFYAAGQWMQYKLIDTTGKEQVVLRRLRDGRQIKWVHKDSPYIVEDKPIATYQTDVGKSCVILNLNSMDSVVLKDVDQVFFFNNHKTIAYIRKTEQSNDLCIGGATKGAKQHCIFSDKSKKLKHFMLNYGQKRGTFEIDSLIYAFNLADNSVKQIFDKSSVRLPAPFYLAKGSFSMQNHDRYIVFDVYDSMPTEPKKRDKNRRDTTFTLQLWTWNETVSQGIQEQSYREPRPKPMKYVHDIERGIQYKVSDQNCEWISFPSTRRGKFAFKSDETPYAGMQDWQHDPRMDLYVINLATGENHKFATATTFRAHWSPKGDYIVYFDSKNRCWLALNPETMQTRNLSKDIPYPVYNEEHDTPNPAPAYGIEAWDISGRIAYISDRYDIWAVDVTGEQPTTCYTRGYGRKHNKVLDFLNVYTSDITIDPTKDQELSLYNLTNGDMGFYTISPQGKITKNFEAPYHIRIDKQSADKRTYLYVRQSYDEPRELWIADSKFRNQRRLTFSNPQQQEYNWGSVQMVEWTNYDGKPNKGLLFLPENYDKDKSYPTIVNFYETHAGEFHIYHTPSLCSSTLDIPTYVSNGYIIFQPDVKFKLGQPGKSSYSAVVSGTKALIERGIIDPKRVGVQGHSWSGYQTSYLVTKTDIFTCASIGAPIVNMTMAYNGIREGSGMPRMFMYEDWQSRMGTTLWENLEGYIESSPILWADKITTPVMILHCDKDEAVSYPEGRSLFLALRRLQRPAWLLNYKGLGHFVSTRPAQIDWTIRMTQFFDHYLKGAPMPRWMSEGINANEQGYDKKLN